MVELDPFFAVQQFYKIEKNQSCGKLPLVANNVKYDIGFGVHSNCVMKFNIKGLGFKRFVGMAAKLDTTSRRENYLEMEVLVDGRKAFSTGKLTIGDEPVPFDVEINDAEVLELLVLDSGDNQTCDLSSWLNPMLLR